ncbi:MAG TPA: hypothetical protein VFT02_14825, partial [Pyrinomonadaceae bacterium]|nr:hypothetical protein [Pyrinomonadaceae bacterium]
MADQTTIRNARLSAAIPALDRATLRPDVARLRADLIPRPDFTPLPPSPQPVPLPPPVAQPLPPPVVPPAPAENIFTNLPFPSAGDRIK